MPGPLGRTKLKARIHALEETVAQLRAELAGLVAEADRLRRQAERYRERRGEAMAARQEAETRAKRLEERLARLEEPERGKEPEETGPGARPYADLDDRRRRTVMDRLASFRAGPRGALTATVGDGVPEVVADALGGRAAAARDAAPCLLLADDAGIVSVALRPPLLPMVLPTWGERFVLDEDWFVPRGRFVFALVRSDLFAAGTYDGSQQVAFKGFSPRVGRRHSKGGFSQGRFEQGRQEQIAEHLRRCRAAMDDLDGERLYVVGQREAVQALAKDLCPDATAAVDATGAPRKALEDAFRSFWTTRMRVL